MWKILAYVLLVLQNPLPPAHLSYSYMAITYFGYTTIGGTGTNENGYTIIRKGTCPGSGDQTLVDISAYLAGVGSDGNVRLALYNMVGNKVAEGTGQVAISNDAGWQGHIGAANISPNPCTLSGGTAYYILASYDGAGSRTYRNSGGTSGVDCYLAGDLTGGFPATISVPPDDIGNLQYSIRAGVEPAAGGSATPQLMMMGMGP